MILKMKNKSKRFFLPVFKIIFNALFFYLKLDIET